MPKPSKPSELSPAGRHHLLVPGSVLLSIGLYYGVGAPFVVVAMVAIAFAVVYALAPGWVAADRAAFDRDALALRAAGDPLKLAKRFEQARMLRWLGAPGEVAERAAMVAEAGARFEDARRLYLTAAQGWTGEPPLAVRVGHAHAAFEAGADREALRAYETLIAQGHALPRIDERLRILRARVDGPGLDASPGPRAWSVPRPSEAPAPLSAPDAEHGTVGARDVDGARVEPSQPAPRRASTSTPARAKGRPRRRGRR